MNRHKKINLHRVLLITTGVAILYGAGYWSYYTYEVNYRLADTQDTLASSTVAFMSVIQKQRKQISDTIKENTNLTSFLTAEQKRRIDLEQAKADLEEVKANNEKQIDTLTKLTTIDPELLKKYSKVYFLSENYVPPKLDDIDPIYLTDPAKTNQFLDQAYPFLTDIIKAAAADKVTLLVISAYRSFAYQKALKSDYKIVYGAGTANQFSAEQGYSEHQLGTALDFGTPEVTGAELTFEDTSASKWLNANAYKYGFIISYPKANTFYEYEPWHWRFVGKQLAKDLHDKGMYFYEMDQRDIDAYLIKIFDQSLI